MSGWNPWRDCRGAASRAVVVLGTAWLAGSGFLLFLYARTQAPAVVESRQRAQQRPSPTPAQNLSRAAYEKFLGRALAPGRLMELIVTGSEKSMEGRKHTLLRLVEFNWDNKPLAQEDLRVQGELVFCNAIVLRLPGADPEDRPLLCLFGCLYTDEAKPEEGYRLFDASAAGVPGKFRSDEWPEDMQNRVWTHLRKCITSPEHARASGVGVERIKAVPVVLSAGGIYSIRVDDGRLLLQERRAPAPAKKDAPAEKEE